VRDKAISVLLELRNISKANDDYEEILRLALRLAHDDSEPARVDSLKILEEISLGMGQNLCELFIVPEIRSLGKDESALVRATVASKLPAIAKIVSSGYFSANVFPLYEELTSDKEEKVRKTCADVVGKVAEISPVSQVGKPLEGIFYRFLKDPTSKLVRGTAFQHIGPFIAAVKEVISIDGDICHFYISTTEATSNKDVLYYAAYNFPAFVDTFRETHWDSFRGVYLKFVKTGDPKIKRTLACSIHELARILGAEITEKDLMPIIEKFLKD